MGESSFIEIGISKGDERLRRVSILLTTLAVLSLSHSIIFSRLEIGHWGLANGLPITFFIALALLVVAAALLWISRERNTKLLCLQLLIVIMALAMVPLITGGSISFINHGYRNIGYVEYIARQAHFDTQVTFYLSWPGGFILPTMISVLGQIDFTPLIEILPFFFLPILFFLPLYIFMKNTLGESRSKYIWAGILIYYMAVGGASNLISAGGTAAFLLLTILALLTNRRLWHGDGKPLPFVLLIIITFAAMVSCHLLTSLATLGIIAALALVRRNNHLIVTAVIALAVLLAWNLTVAGDFIIPRLPFIGEKGLIFNFDLLTEREITGHIIGSRSHIDVALIKIIHAAFFILIGFAGFLVSLFVRRDLRSAISLAAITTIPIPLVVLSNFYTEEIITRIYGFIMPGLAYFSTRLFDINKRFMAIIVCVLLLIAIPMKLVATYGNQEFDYFSPGQQAGTLFFHDSVGQGIVFGAWPMGAVENTEKHLLLDLDNLRWYRNRLVVFPWLSEYGSYYIGISRQDRASYEWLQGNTDFINNIEKKLQDTNNIDFIYHNPDLQLYIHQID